MKTLLFVISAMFLMGCKYPSLDLNKRCENICVKKGFVTGRYSTTRDCYCVNVDKDGVVSTHQYIEVDF